MGRLSSHGARRLIRVLAVSALAIGALGTWAFASGAGGWDHLGDGGTPGTDSLNLVASSLAVSAGVLYVGGEFTAAGGHADADRIAKWNGSSWTPVGSATERITDGRVMAIAVSGNKVYAGGSFHNAGGNDFADFLAVWDGVSWEPVCGGAQPAFTHNVTSLQIIDQTLYVGGTFQNAAGIPSADYLLACDLASGTPSSTVIDEDHAFSGSVYALAAGSDGTLYAGGGFILDTTLGPDPDPDADANNVAYLPSGDTWQRMGTGGGACLCAVDDFVRGLTAVGTDVYIGTDAEDVAGIPEADHVAKWNGSAWSALGGNGSGDGWLVGEFGTTINALTGFGSHLFVAGDFLNANGEARADYVAYYDGTNWHPLGSNGGNDGPFPAAGLALALIDRQLYAAGSFTFAGGDPQAHSVASFSLTQIIAYPTPTVTPGPGPVPTPTVTPTPDATPPRTSLRTAKINQTLRKATFSFASGERGSTFSCKLDDRKRAACTSPKTYKKLAPGKHAFRVRARDRAGNLDASPAVKRFTIRKR